MSSYISTVLPATEPIRLPVVTLDPEVRRLLMIARSPPSRLANGLGNLDVPDVRADQAQVAQLLADGLEVLVEHGVAER
jgi:hypothetical protein